MFRHSVVIDSLRVSKLAFVTSISNGVTSVATKKSSCKVQLAFSIVHVAVICLVDLSLAPFHVDSVITPSQRLRLNSIAISGEIQFFVDELASVTLTSRQLGGASVCGTKTFAKAGPVTWPGSPEESLLNVLCEILCQPIRTNYFIASLKCCSISLYSAFVLPSKAVHITITHTWFNETP